MADLKPRVLRVTGVPREMASGAIDALLTGHRGVLSIDAVEPTVDDAHDDAVHVVVEEAQAQRVRAKLSTAFAGIDVDDVTDERAAGQAPAVRIRAEAAAATPPTLALEPPSRRPRP
jgi:hypothetical protein